MLHKHLAGDAIASLLSRAEVPVKETKKPVLDSADNDSDDEGVMDAAGDYASSDLALKSGAALQEWAETSSDDLDEGEGLGDRLFSLIAGIADADMDGEVSEDEADVMMMAAENGVDYLIGKGVPEDDAVALLSDFDNEVAARVQELLAERLPDGEEAAAQDLDVFAFGDGSDEAAMDAVYKKKIAIRKGKKVRINKRVSGTVRLSAKQKLAVRKMLRKSHSAVATMRRAKSMKIRRKMGV